MDPLSHATYIFAPHEPSIHQNHSSKNLPKPGHTFIHHLPSPPPPPPSPPPIPFSCVLLFPPAHDHPPHSFPYLLYVYLYIPYNTTQPEQKPNPMCNSNHQTKGSTLYKYKHFRKRRKEDAASINAPQTLTINFGLC